MATDVRQWNLERDARTRTYRPGRVEVKELLVSPVRERVPVVVLGKFGAADCAFDQCGMRASMSGSGPRLGAGPGAMRLCTCIRPISWLAST